MQKFKFWNFWERAPYLKSVSMPLTYNAIVSGCAIGLLGLLRYWIVTWRCKGVHTDWLTLIVNKQIKTKALSWRIWSNEFYIGEYNLNFHYCVFFKGLISKKTTDQLFCLFVFCITRSISRRVTIIYTTGRKINNDIK